MTDPIAEALDVLVPAFVSVDSDWQGVLQAAGHPAALSPVHRQSSPARRSGLRLPPDWPRLTMSNRAKILGIAAAAGVAALIAFVAVPSSGHRDATTTTTPGPGGSPGQPGTPVPLARALSLASGSFGVPIKLPDTSVLKPSDANQTAIVEWVLNAGTDPPPVSSLDVEFPNAQIGYRLTDSSEDPNALNEYKAQMAEVPTNPADTQPKYQIVYLSDGTPALLGAKPWGNTIQFREGPLSIIIASSSIDANAIQALAQSIQDQTPTSP